MNKLTVEQMQDVMHAIRHYQYHHISINNPRYDEFSNILNVLVEEIHNENFSRHSVSDKRPESLDDGADRWSYYEPDPNPQVRS